MSSLNGAVSVVEVYDVTILISDNLNLDVLRVFEVLLNKYIIDTECSLSFTLCSSILIYDIIFASYDSHTTAAATSCCLKHNWVSASVCEFNRLVLVLDS